MYYDDKRPYSLLTTDKKPLYMLNHHETFCEGCKYCN